MTPEAAAIFLDEAARYFENRPTLGEDRAHWSNVQNAETCRNIAKMIASANDRDECICPKCGIRHGGRTTSDPGF